MPENNKAIVEAYREKRISKKTGNVYEVLVLCFENGYKMDPFLTSEQSFIIKDIVPSVN